MEGVPTLYRQQKMKQASVYTIAFLLLASQVCPAVIGTSDPGYMKLLESLTWTESSVQ